MSNVGEIRRLHDFNEMVDDLEKVRLRFQRSWHDRKLVVLQHSGKTESCLKCTTAGCCHQTVYATMIEVLPLARRLHREKRNTIELRKQLRELGEQMEGVKADEWFDRVIPCSFLSDRKLCTIYEHRPLACYGYIVTTPSDLCSPPGVKGRMIASLDPGDWVEVSWRNQLSFQKYCSISTEFLQFGTLQRLVAIALEGLIGPWEKFIEYISGHEYPARIPGAPGVYDIPGWIRGTNNPFVKRREANVQGDLPSQGSSGDGHQGAGSKGSDR